MSLANSVSPMVSTGWIASGSTGRDGQGKGFSTIGIGPSYQSVMDAKGTAGNMADAYMTRAEDLIGGGVASASGGVDFIKDAYNQSFGPNSLMWNNINSSYKKINQFADQAADSASKITNSVNNVNSQANKVNSSAESLSPFISDIAGKGSDMYQTGAGIIGRANGFYGTANDILGLNQNAGGMAGNFVQALLGINPDAYVSMAANDVQSSYENSLDQLNRGLSRSGVDAGSARSAALKQQYAQLMASAKAAAKTRARQMGLKDQLAAYSSAFGTAQNLAGLGNQTAQMGVGVQNAGAGLLSDAARIQAQQGQLYGQAGQLNATAGQLLGQQSNAYTNAGQMTQAGGNFLLGAANAKMNAANAVGKAQNDLANAQMMASQYYAQQAAGFAQIAGEQGLMAALGF